MHRSSITLLIATAIVLGLFPARAQGQDVVIPEQLKQRVEAKGWSQQWHDELYDYEDAAVGLALRQMLRARRDEQALNAGLVVHEWGSMKHHLGSSSSDFDLIGEDHSDLPPFANVWADQPWRAPHIAEKPILYFYTKQKRRVSVTVRFPEGVLTQWYPNVTYFSPQRDQAPQPNQVPPKNGSLVWHQVDLDPETETRMFLNLDKNHPWWHIVRDTDATPVRVTNPNTPNAGVVERFLFYRGAGSYTPMVTPTRGADEAGLSVRVPFSQIDLRGVFLVRVNDSGATITHAPVLRAERTMKLAGPDAIKPVKQAAETAKAQLTDSLEAAGLFPKEAAGLVKIWGDDMFTTPGERLLYLMPDNEVERLLPLHIQPAPSQTVRTMIAWVELSTPQAEQRVMDLVNKLGSDDEQERDAADKQLRSLDRFAEAILQRALGKTTNPIVKQRIEQILNTLEIERSRGKAPQPNGRR